MSATVILDEVVGARAAWSRVVEEGQTLRIVDLAGNQAVDCLLYNAHDPVERYSAADTIVAQRNIFLVAGTQLMSNEGAPLMTITATTCAYHDTIGGACSRESNTLRYGHHTADQHACVDNFLDEGMRRGLTKRDLVSNINWFMNVPIGDDGTLGIVDGISAPGLSVDVRAEMDVLVLISNCPQINNPCNGFDPTSVRVLVLDADTTRPVAGPGHACLVDVVEGGSFTTVQDLPGRIGFWHVGVPPNGPMDDLGHNLVNQVVGNRPGAAGLELTGGGPTLRFTAPALIALGGAPMPMHLDGRRVESWTPVDVPAGGVVTIGATNGPGLRAALAVRGGLGVEPFLGSRSTFTLGGFGGYEGRALTAGDVLPVGHDIGGPPRGLPAGMAPVLHSAWRIGVLVGPHSTPEFLTPEGLHALLRAEWQVHFNSARTGIRLIGPRPGWSRLDGGDAGLHPSNIHDTGYAIGAVDLTGDMPVILGPDGPSLGGFVCPAVVAAAERWKLGQLRPGDSVRLVPWSPSQAAAADRRRAHWLGRATEPVEPLARPSWNTSAGGAGGGGEASAGGAGGGGGGGGGAVLARMPADGDRPAIAYRRAGDRFLLVEYGEMTLDLELRLRVHSLDRWVAANLRRGVIDATPGVRSLLVQVDGDLLTVDGAFRALCAAEDELPDIAEEPFASRVVHLPLSWDDPATREATLRYVRGVRADAPWCPWNIEFIRRINGLDSTDDVRRIVFEASYLVLGLGDVYLGAPVATPLDPRHRLVTTKYNPARTWTAENSVGIGGAYLCIYGMEGPGGYQFVGRTVQVWNRHRRGRHFGEPWLLRPFDQLRWFPVEADDLLEMRAAQERGELDIKMEENSFRLRDHQRFLAAHDSDIARFRTTQRAAFEAERLRWERDGEFTR